MVTLLIYEWEQMEIVKYKFKDQIEAEDFITNPKRRISVEFSLNFNWVHYYDRCIAGKK